MENDLDAVLLVIKHVGAAQMAQNWVRGIVCHVVSDYGRKSVALQSVDAAFKGNQVLVTDEMRRVREVSSAEDMGVTSGTKIREATRQRIVPGCFIKNTFPYRVLNFLDGVFELFHDSLALQGFYREAMGRSRHDDERNNGYWRIARF